MVAEAALTTGFRKIAVVFAILGAILIAFTLWLWGQPLICTCGYVQFWVGNVFSSDNSQHIADWYTLSHFVHGMLVVVFARFLFPSSSYQAGFAIVLVTGVGWEILEHTEWVLDRFRAETLYQGYTGDSVLNAVADYLWMFAGFALARSASTIWTLIVVATLEITSALIARDSLTLTTLMLIHTFEPIESWQQELNPNRRD